MRHARMLGLRWLLVVLAALVAGIALAAGATVRGVVQAGGAPVRGARVELRGAATHRATTDAKGAFTIKEVAAGRYQLRVEAAGHAPHAQTLDLVEGKVANLLIELRPAPGPALQAAPAATADESAAPSPVRAAPVGAAKHEPVAPMSAGAPMGGSSGAMPPSRSSRRQASGDRGDPSTGNTESYVDHG